MCLVSLSLRTGREYLSKLISLMSGLFLLFILFIAFISEENLFQESMQRLYIHFRPKDEVLYRGTYSCADVACLVDCLYISSVLRKVSVNERGRLL